MGVRRVGIVGGGIVGVALARRVAGLGRDVAVTVLEKEPEVARHQTGRNSGVVHAGLYYTPGSLKARLCRRGVELLSEFCAASGLTYDRCGKVVVALDQTELGRLEAIHERAAANRVPGVRMIGREELRELEPHVEGIAALHSPETAVVDFGAVTRRLAADAAALGVGIRTGVAVRGIHQDAGGVEVDAGGERLRFDELVICGGLHTDRLARLAGDDDDPRVVPFRGEYYELTPDRRSLVNGLVYPVPDPRYPFLGVHLTRRVDGGVLVGPNAVLALAREGYRWRDLRPRDLAETLAWPGFRRMAARHWRTGVREVVGSLSRRAFCDAARRYVPELRPDDLLRARSGVRAQAVARDGSLVDDFRISRQGRVVAIRNAPSPAATSSMAIAEHIAAWLFDGDRGPAPR
ncbi:MAG TPA: L-2-hydroxyglutarate oxidase [Actinomycetota bacterium]|jgi:L-2-hydroxyglutarate oxidase LhgO|nr:L-2-hydroxyglutarate oxidase [Actinomycetota bacterium]